MKLTKPIIGVPDCEIYPREIPAGEECPVNLRDYAQGEGALEKPASKKAPSEK